MKRLLSLVAALAALALAGSAQATMITWHANSNGGENTSAFSAAGTAWATSTAKSSADATTRTGSKYSGTATYVGIDRWAKWSYTIPQGGSGEWKIEVTWPSSTAHTAAQWQLYTGSAAPSGTYIDRLSKDESKNANTWVTLWSNQVLTAGTTYSVATFALTTQSGTRIMADGIRFTQITPEPAALALLSIGGLFLRRRR